jgi:hypothetical protein
MEENKADIIKQPGAFPKQKHLSFSIMYSFNPNLYIINSFRITGLAVDASPRDVARQGERLKIMQKLDAAPIKIRGILPLELEKDDHGLRDAIHRLYDPDKRLVDELFWFWPQIFGQSREDMALQALLRGDRDGALKIWIDQESAPCEGFVATHNLAVFSHATALDMEHLGRPLSTTEQIDRDAHWRQAFGRWKILVDCQDFWRRLDERIRDFDDPRLTAETAAHIRKSMPLALLSLNASLAVKAAELGDTIEVARQKKLMDTSGFPDDMVKRALRYAVKSMRDRINLLCINAASEMETDSTDHERIAMSLVDNSRIPLQALDSVLPAGYATLDGAHDIVAERILLLMIGMLEKSNKYQESLDLMKKALNMARGQALRSRIERNIEIVSRNLEEQILLKTCWFCKTNPADDGSKVDVKMQGMTKQESLNSWDMANWNNVTISVPRCLLCKHRHTAAEEHSMVKVLAGLALGKFEIGKHKDKNIFPEAINQDVETMGLQSKSDFPAVQDRLSKGWKLVENKKKKPSN